jgi:uncharacterized membrane protein
MYFTLKLIHIAAVVLFLGNIITGLFWHALAARSRDPRILAFTMDGIIRSDRLFTMPGVVVIIAAGVALAVLGKFPLLGTGWILWSIVLFGVSGALFGMRVVPLQRELRALAETGARTGDFDFAAYMARARAWERWGALALATPLGALTLMVLKPDL